MTRYEIQSGRPAGEVYDWWVFFAPTFYDAMGCRSAMRARIKKLPEHQRENWLWGPTVYRRDADDPILEWNGFEEVPATKWMGTF